MSVETKIVGSSRIVGDSGKRRVGSTRTTHVSGPVPSGLSTPVGFVSDFLLDFGATMTSVSEVNKHTCAVGSRAADTERSVSMSIINPNGCRTNSKAYPGLAHNPDVDLLSHRRDPNLRQKVVLKELGV